MDTMQIGTQIKRHRAELALSQDGLAAKVYVSRQTISSWETGKTYPDVQSLLLLSEIFGVTVDDLVKGDLETMNKAIDSDIILMKRLSIAILSFLLLMLACLIWLSVQMIAWGWTFAQTMPTALLALSMWGIAMFFAVWTERIKKDRDLITYREIKDFLAGRTVDRSTERGRRERMIPRWMKIVRTVGLTLLAAAIGAFFGYGGAALADHLMG